MENRTAFPKRAVSWESSRIHEAFLKPIPESTPNHKHLLFGPMSLTKQTSPIRPQCLSQFYGSFECLFLFWLSVQVLDTTLMGVDLAIIKQEWLTKFHSPVF